MISEEFVDEIVRLASNCRSAKNEKILEQVINFLSNEVQIIETQRRYNKDVEIFVMEKKSDALLRGLREKVKFWEEKISREEVPNHIKSKGPEYEAFWLKMFREEYNLAQSVSMAVLVADEAVREKEEAANQ